MKSYVAEWMPMMSLDDNSETQKTQYTLTLSLKQTHFI